jgi:hypothetical protein
MRVCLSSLVTGMEPQRSAVVAALRALRHEPITAETFGALPQSPRIACLEGVRSSECVVLVLGSRYGAVQASGISATHEEFNEARDSRPVFVFIDGTTVREPEQAAFIQEVQAWQGGQFTATFHSAEELRDAVTGALSQWAVSQAAGGPNASELTARATALLPPSGRQGFHQGVPTIALAVAGGPLRTVLRPVKLESEELRRHLHQIARFGTTPIFVEDEGAKHAIEGHTLTIFQRNRSVLLGEDGSVRVVLPLEEGRDGVTATIVEDVQATLHKALRFASSVMEYVDDAQRLSHIVVAARLSDTGGRSWRTRAEHARSPDSGSWGMNAGVSEPVMLSPAMQPRAAFRQRADHMAEDLAVLLRRQSRA